MIQGRKVPDRNSGFLLHDDVAGQNDATAGEIEGGFDAEVGAAGLALRLKEIDGIHFANLQ